jgi:hypothetical protein
MPPSQTNPLRPDKSDKFSIPFPFHHLPTHRLRPERPEPRPVWPTTNSVPRRRNSSNPSSSLDPRCPRSTGSAVPDRRPPRSSTSQIAGRIRPSSPNSARSPQVDALVGQPRHRPQAHVPLTHWEAAAPAWETALRAPGRAFFSRGRRGVDCFLIFLSEDLGVNGPTVLCCFRRIRLCFWINLY